MTQMYPRKHSIDDLLKWPILGILELEFRKTIHMAFVYGRLALLVTKDDKVYVIGNNALGYLNRSESEVNSYFCPREVEELSHKGIKTFCFFDDSSVMALTEEGVMYVVSALELRPSTNLYLVDIRDIAYRSGQVITLHKNYEVRVAQWSHSKEPVPSTSREVCNNRHRSKVICIKTTRDTCVALMEDGKVYMMVNREISHREKKMPDGVKIEKIACGKSHILALSDAGHVYAWGQNFSGQLGFMLKDQTCTDVPQKVSILGVNRVTEIAASRHCDISVAGTACGKVCIWGNCGDVIIRTPRIVPYTSIHEVFVTFANTYVMHEPLIIDAHYESNSIIDSDAHYESNSIIDSLASAFDDQNTSDFTIVVEGKPIHVHKTILKIASEHFRWIFETNLAENNTNVMVLKDFSYAVYKVYLKYLYTGKIDSPLPDRLGLELLLLATVYLDSRLQKLCKEIVLHETSVSNVLDVFVTARQHSIQSLEEYCMNFILHHLTDVVKSEGYTCLDAEIVKELMAVVANKGLLKN